MSTQTPNLFQSTRPVRGATAIPKHPQSTRGISIHAPRAGRDALRSVSLKVEIISIHAPRAGRDKRFPRFTPVIPISIHAPRAGRDADFFQGHDQRQAFQSTRPVRGATESLPALILPHGISIHAPRAGRDSKSIQNYFTHFCDKRQFLDNFTQNAAF